MPDPVDEPVGVALDDGVSDAVWLPEIDGVSLMLLVSEGLAPLDRLGVDDREMLSVWGALNVGVIEEVPEPDDVGEQVPDGVLVPEPVVLAVGSMLLVNDGLAPRLNVDEGVAVVLGVSSPLEVVEDVGVVVGEGVDVPVDEAVGVPDCVGVIEDEADGGRVL